MPNPTNQPLDPEEITALKRRLAVHRRNLYTLEEQKAKYGLDVPLRIINEIAEQKAAIAQLEARLEELEARAPMPQTGQPEGAGAIYHVHIERASGLAIGDEAQVVQTRDESDHPLGEGPKSTEAATSRDQRCADLAESIRETLDLIKGYEDQRRLADDPKVKRRAEREIADLRQQLAEYEAEARELGCK
jgi:hypothetical protein